MTWTVNPRFIAEIHGIREEIICGIGYAGSLYPWKEELYEQE
jgi:hypothetical protein